MKKAENDGKRKLSFRFVPNRRVIENSKKIGKNRKKLKKIPFWFHLKPKQVGKGQERQKTKIIVPFRSYPTRNRKFQKNSRKQFRKFKNTIVASFQAIIGWNRPPNRENKNYRSVSFQPDG